MDPNLDQFADRLITSWSKTFKKMQSEIMHHRGLGLTGPQFHMLAIIAKEQSCNVTYLSEKLEVKPSAITVMLDRLVQNGYVDRRNDDQDRRAVLLSVTEEGARIFAEAKVKSREVLKSYLAHLSHEEIMVLISVTEKFAELERTQDKP